MMLLKCKSVHLTLIFRRRRRQQERIDGRGREKKSEASTREKQTNTKSLSERMA
jgi:hypothetical protein